MGVKYQKLSSVRALGTLEVPVLLQVQLSLHARGMGLNPSRSCSSRLNEAHYNGCGLVGVNLKGFVDLGAKRRLV